MSADESARPPLTISVPGYTVTVTPTDAPAGGRARPAVAVDHAEVNGVPARRGGRPGSGCAAAVWALLQSKGRLGPADLDRLLNAGADPPRYGASTIKDALARLVAAGLAVNVGGRYEPAEAE